MSYYADLTEYVYHNSMFWVTETKNIGWLSVEHEFSKVEPSETLLDKIWDFCKISVAQMRGIHDCDICAHTRTAYARRGDDSLLLGSSEIRVFSTARIIYAAPTLIYHYMAVHHYSPPDEFLRAVHEGPSPPGQSYFDQLARMGLVWGNTSAPAEEPARYKFVREGDAVVRRRV